MVELFLDEDFVLGIAVFSSQIDSEYSQGGASAAEGDWAPNCRIV